jgi:hypothetical protein
MKRFNLKRLKVAEFNGSMSSRMLISQAGLLRCKTYFKTYRKEDIQETWE